MKFITIPNIIRTNTLFSKLKSIDPKRSIELEAYSCKQTKHQKSHRSLPKPLRFYVSTLELSLPDFDFSHISMDVFRATSLQQMKDELSFVLFTIYRNQNEVGEMIDFFSEVLSQSVSLRTSLFYCVGVPASDEGETVRIFLVHDRKQKRIIVLKITEEF